MHQHLAVGLRYELAMLIVAFAGKHHGASLLLRLGMQLGDRPRWFHGAAHLHPNLLPVEGEGLHGPMWSNVSIVVF